MAFLWEAAFLNKGRAGAEGALRLRAATAFQSVVTLGKFISRHLGFPIYILGPYISLAGLDWMRTEFHTQ